MLIILEIAIALYLACGLTVLFYARNNVGASANPTLACFFFLFISPALLVILGIIYVTIGQRGVDDFSNWIDDLYSRKG